MKTIQVEELEQLSADEIQVIDLRPEEEYKRGSFPGAVNLPMEEFDSRYEEVLEKKSQFTLSVIPEREVRIILKQRQKPDTMLLM